MKRSFLFAALALALVVGAWHLTLAVQAIFVFRNGEPTASWVAVLVGPGSTLLAATLAFFHNRVGGYWLIAGGMFSFGVFAFENPADFANLVQFVWRISAPMVLMGASIVLLSHR